MSGEISEQKTELGFPVESKAEALAESMRGKYDVTRMQRDNPKLVDLIAWLLSLPGMTYQAIAQASGISWETVSAIAAAKVEPIREFKLRQATRVQLVMDAMLPGMMADAAKGKLKPLDYKLLAEAHAMMTGEPGMIVRIETTETPQRRAFRQFIELGGSIIDLPAENIPQAAALPLDAGAPSRECVQVNTQYGQGGES